MLYEPREQYDEMEAILIEVETGCPIQGNRQLTGWFLWELQEHGTNLSVVARGH